MSDPILIAGAGIGGLCAALTLARNGHRVELIERRAGFDETGAGIQISPNASRILRHLRLEERLARHVVDAERLVVRGFGRGDSLGSVSLSDLAKRMGSPYWCIRRADLQGVLLEAVSSEPLVEITTDRVVAGIEEQPGRLDVLIEDAAGLRDIRPAALLVGADGLWSVTSRVLHRRVPDPRFTGYEAWRAQVPMAHVPAPLQRAEVALWLGDDAHVVHYPVEAGATLNVVLVRGGREAVTGWTRAGDRQRLAGLIDAAHPPLRRLLGDIEAWQVWSLFDAPVRAMAGGRIALVGDAAHPVLPFLAQGGALAIEDAAVLAQLLGPASLMPHGLTQALAGYDRLRRPRAARVQQAARTNGRIYHLGWPASMARDAVMGALGSDGLGRRYDWLYGWRHQHP